MICKNCKKPIRLSTVWPDIWIHCETKKDMCDGEVSSFAMPDDEGILDDTARVKTSQA
jgi:hypothetical protein